MTQHYERGQFTSDNAKDLDGKTVTITTYEDEWELATTYSNVDVLYAHGHPWLCVSAHRSDGFPGEVSYVYLEIIESVEVHP